MEIALSQGGHGPLWSPLSSTTVGANAVSVKSDPIGGDDGRLNFYQLGDSFCDKIDIHHSILIELLASRWLLSETSR